MRCKSQTQTKHKSSFFPLNHTSIELVSLPLPAPPLSVPSASSTVLLGNFPAPVRRRLTHLLCTAPSLQVAPVQPLRGQLARAAAQYQPALVIVAENEVSELGALAHHYSVPVLLYCTTPPLSSRMRLLARWNVQDYVGPGVPINHPDFAAWRTEVLHKIRNVLVPGLPVRMRHATPSRLPSSIVVIGGSTGGSVAAETILRSLLPTSTAAVLVAVHLPLHFTQALVERLQRSSALPVVAGETGTVLEPGKVIVAPGGCNMLVKAAADTPWVRWQTECRPTSGTNLSADSPSIDLLMQSVVQTTSRPTLGVVLSGLGQDGTVGARYIQQYGGRVVAQDYASAAVYSMPESVIRAGLADAVLPLPGIATFINQFVSQARPGYRQTVSSSSHAA